MTPIRPQPPLAPTPQARPLDPGRQAAQRAFFAAALGRAAPAPVVGAAGAATSPPSARQASPTEASPQPPRPGSLLDIRV